MSTVFQGAVTLHRVSTGGFSPFSAGFDFRSTSGYVTDSAGFTYVLKTDTYPTTRGGFTFGWAIDNQTVLDADRNASNDPRIAGINFVPGASNGNPIGNTYFRVDLPSAGGYNVYLAIGDSFGQFNQYVEIRDTTTSLSFTIGPTNTAANHYLDANATDLTNATWPGSQTPKAATFATTQLRLYPGALAASDVTTIANLQIVRTS